MEDLVTTGLNFPVGIALDLGTGRMYWTDNGDRTIMRANLNGGNVQAMVNMGLDGPEFIAIAAPRPDTDGDGVMDDCDGCPNDPARSEPGACGCVQPDADLNGDGVIDCLESTNMTDTNGVCCAPNAMPTVGLILPMVMIGWKYRRSRGFAGNKP